MLEDKNTNILIICRTEQDLIFFEKIVNMDNKKSVIASDSIEVKIKARRKYCNTKVNFIEGMESLFSVSDSVLKIREQVNDWLVKLNPKIPRYLLEWIKWVEGGNTTQKIQDAVLLINSYEKLITKYNIGCIYIFRRIHSYWEDEILLEVAKSLQVPVKQYKNLFFIFCIILKIRGIKRKIINGRYITFYLPKFILIKLKQIRLILRIVKSKFVKREKQIRKKKQEITFLVGSSTDKHVNNVLSVMKEFQNRNNYLPVALCWNASSGSNKIRRNKLLSEKLETYFPLEKIGKLFGNYFYAANQCIKRNTMFIDKNFFTYKDVPLDKILWDFIIIFVKLEFLSRLFMYYSTLNYLKYYTPIAVRTWGENVLDYGSIFSHVLRKKKDSLKSLIFHYPVGITLENPYHDCYNKPDILFVSGLIDKDLTQSYVNNSSKIVVSGFGKNSNISDFKKNYNKETSKRLLSISSNYDLSIFYVSTGVLRGYVSVKEQTELAQSLFDFITTNNNLLLILKPHPSEDECFWYNIIKSYRNPTNIYLFDKNINPYHCINASDLVITKFSTLALEAMELMKPVISVVLDGEDRFLNIFHDGVEKFDSISSFSKFLSKISNDKIVFKKWKVERIEEQNKFIEKKMYKPFTTVEKLIVDEVISEINKKF